MTICFQPSRKKAATVSCTRGGHSCRIAVYRLYGRLLLRLRCPMIPRSFICIPSLNQYLPLRYTRRGTRAAILGEAGEEQPLNDERGFEAEKWAPNAPGVGGGYGSAEVDARRGGSGMRRTDRIARRQARTEASAVGAGMGWPPPHAPN